MLLLVCDHALAGNGCFSLICRGSTLSWPVVKLASYVPDEILGSRTRDRASNHSMVIAGKYVAYLYLHLG
jgi:hypothetical protein